MNSDPGQGTERLQFRKEKDNSVAKRHKTGFEDQMLRLQDVVRELESADLPLERNVALYKEGMILVRACKELLERARHEVLLVNEDGSKVPFASPDEDDGWTDD